MKERGQDIHHSRLVSLHTGVMHNCHVSCTNRDITEILTAVGSLQNDTRNVKNVWLNIQNVVVFIFQTLCA